MMRKLENILKSNEGYSLIEMVITIAIIAVAISITSFGIGSIYSSNVKNYSSQIISELRNVQIKELAAKDNNYRLQLSKVGNNYVGRTLVDRDTDDDGAVDSLNNVINEINFHSNISIKKYNTSSMVYEEIDTLASSELLFEFDPASGALLTNGGGTYQIQLQDSGPIIEFEVIQQNGRVFEHE